MKTIALTIGIIMIILVNAFSQVSTSPITKEKKRYYHEGKALKPVELLTLLKNNPASAEEYQIAKKNSNIGNPLIAIGTATILVGSIVNLASTIKEADDASQGKVSSTSTTGLSIMLIGVGFDLIGLPFAISANKHYKKAIAQYNESVKSSGIKNLQLNMAVNPNGLTLRMRF